MVDRETIERGDKRLVYQLEFARLGRIGRHRGHQHEAAALPRQGAVSKELVTSDWIEHHRDLLIIGQAGVGKEFRTLTLSATRPAATTGYLPLLWSATVARRPAARAR